ncbi:PelD GGDEF domain-containing protein, partial [bacterium]|nr:PelD GGDEF domain-containing protein [bacterium]
LVKMTHLKRDLDVISTLVVINLHPGARLDELCLVLERQQRGLDHSWRRSLGWGVQFVTLMPFSGPAAIDGYQSRLNEVLKHQFQMTLKSSGITFKYSVISGDEPLLQLANLLSEEQ